MGTRTNPIPNGEQWVTVSADGPDECCGFRAKSNCFVCCAPFSFLPPFSESSESLEYVAEKPLEDGLAITRGAVAPDRGTGARSGLPPAREKQTSEPRPIVFACGFALGVGGFAIVGLLLRQYAPQYAPMVCPSIQLRRRSSSDGSGLPQFS